MPPLSWSSAEPCPQHEVIGLPMMAAYEGVQHRQQTCANPEHACRQACGMCACEP